MPININKMVTKPWLGNSNGSLVISIPKKIMENCEITKESYITIEDDENGIITIKKLGLENPIKISK
jgi:hypothetical protein